MNADDIPLRELDDDRILRLIPNDARRRNALSKAMLGRLGSAVADAFAATACVHAKDKRYKRECCRVNNIDHTYLSKN